jgi:hypothetical protein
MRLSISGRRDCAKRKDKKSNTWTGKEASFASLPIDDFGLLAMVGQKVKQNQMQVSEAGWMK